MGPGGKQRIAVLGGGVGALAAAFYLTEQPNAAERYDITVYQQGWRLGGKCASGHDQRPGYGSRIYEHGLHIFAGFYDQAFDLLRRAYGAVGRPPNHPNQTVWDAFTPEDAIALVDPSDPTRPDLVWYLDFQPNDDLPGETVGDPELMAMIQRMVGMLLHGAPAPFKAPGVSGRGGEDLSSLVDDPLAWLSHFVHKGEHEIERLAADLVLRDLGRVLEGYMRSIVESTADPAEKLFAERLILSAFLVQVVIRGVLDGDVIRKGFDVLDTEEWTEWLYRNALAVAREQSPAWGDPTARATQLIHWTPVASLYDYVFGYGGGGDVSKPSFGAGTALRSGMLMISYKGHFFWKMRGAMGDVVIAPLYLALLKRGVKFQFFSRITSLNIDPGSPQIASVDYVRQARLRGDAYHPLITVPIPGWPADMPLEGWPATPLWDQLVDGDKLAAAGRDFEADNNDLPGPGDEPQQLKAGVDFDKVVLGISVGGLKQVCASFPARLPASNWGPMFGAITLTRTCAMQLWLTREMNDLGCPGADRTLTGAAQPYSSWSDMSHLLARETWDGAVRPRAIAYFCGQIQGDEPAGGANRQAYAAAVKWLSANAARYWTKAASPDSPIGLDPALIYDPDPAAGGDVLSRQYIRANCNPSDLYVQSPKNSVYTRMDAHQSGLINLFLTGDWTRNGLNSGCAEAAARSGWRCAQAIAGTLPPLPT